MNKVGFNTLAWSASVSDDLFPILGRLKKIGYDGVECLVVGCSINCILEGIS